MDSRLPAHVEASGLIRQVQAAGGFAAVLHKGEREAGTLLLILTENGTKTRVYERMPQLDGVRNWSCIRTQDVEGKQEFNLYLDRRKDQDRDLWIIELDIADAERFIGIDSPPG